MKPQRGRLVDRPTARAATSTPEARGLARDQVRLLVSSPNGHQHAIFRKLADFLPMGTLLVVNTSATLPASLTASARFGSFTLNL
jgi:S-adenosylmethionine:tRNA ribosyltransferase-isomerase